MKWNTLIGTIVLTIGICSQSFGAGLLDRMLGASGCGCETKCCEASCGAEAAGCCDSGCAAAADPSCGCDNGCAAADPSCGCDNGCAAAPSCGCDAPRKSCRKPLLSGLLSCKKKSCCTAAPSCGCDNGCAAAADPSCGCDNGCAAAPSCGCEAAPSCCKRVSLLERIFSCRKKSCNSCTAAPSCGCDNGCAAAPSCGCDNGCAGAVMEAPAAPEKAAEEAPNPPAPIVDPTAVRTAKRRVVHASFAR